MSTDISATTKVELSIEGRPATIKDVQDALDVLRVEGIPDTFEIHIHQSRDRVWEDGVPVRDQKVRHSIHISAERAAVTP